jgi:DNA-binding SARP family transcriptional activator
MLPKIRIYTFGALQVLRGDHAVTEGDWHTRQARQLLKILLTERPRPVSSDRLIEILWPHSAPDAAATTLRSAINALRNVLEPERPNRAPSRYVITQTPGYAFHLHPDIWLDVEVYEKELEAARRTAHPEQRLRHLETAVSLYQDDYLSSDPYADWVQTERERLQELHFNALLQLAGLHAGFGDYAAAIAATRQILARDEVRENAYQALMRYQAESGDSAAALLTYERCRNLLAEELGADPSPLTQQLHQRILNGEIAHRPEPLLHALRSPGSETDTRSVAAVQTTSPVQRLPQRTLLPVVDGHFLEIFVGRETETALLEAALEQTVDGFGDLLVLEGEAGVGKTRLAYHLLQKATAVQATVLSVTCQPLEQQLPFAPLADLLGRYLHSLPLAALSSLPAASLSQLAQLIPSLYDRLADLPAIGLEGALGADENRQRLIDGLVAFLTALARHRPLVLFLDDLHWADHDTLAVIGRLAQRLDDAPLLIMLAYRTDDLAENEGLVTLLHALKRRREHQLVQVDRLNADHVHQIVQLLLAPRPRAGDQLAEALYTATQGNALFLTEALRDLLERQPTPPAEPGQRTAAIEHPAPALLLRRNPRVQEVILERMERLPAPARELLELAAVIGRDFSLELLEAAAPTDPAPALRELLRRKFLVERADERLDFSHQVVRQVAYETVPLLPRRRLHLRTAQALEKLQRAEERARELAFHYSQAGRSAQQPFAYFSILAGERLLRSFGFRQAIVHFDDALRTLEELPTAPPELTRRGLLGRGLAYESLLDPDGVMESYWRLLNWAGAQGDRTLMLTAHSRFTSMLTLLGKQRESSQLLGELADALAQTGGAALDSRVINDLLARRRLIYQIDFPSHFPSAGDQPGKPMRHDNLEGDADDGWTRYVQPPPVVPDPVQDLLQVLEPVYAVVPLFDYGWTLLVQGQLGEATRCLEAVVDLAGKTAQPSFASAAYHQLAVTARILGDLEQSQRFNEQSMSINRTMTGAAGELASMWPRISSAFLSLRAGRLDEAERRLRRVVNFLDGRNAFHNYRHSANIGLGLVALERGELNQAEALLETAVSDPVNLYPYTHVRALLGLARIAHLRGERAQSGRRLRHALDFAGRRSLLEEYIETVLEIGRLHPDEAPADRLIASVLGYVESLPLESAVTALRRLLSASAHMDLV